MFKLIWFQCVEIISTVFNANKHLERVKQIFFSLYYWLTSLLFQTLRKCHHTAVRNVPHYPLMLGWEILCNSMRIITFINVLFFTFIPQKSDVEAVRALLSVASVHICVDPSSNCQQGACKYV